MRQGEVHCLRANGAGKSTLMNIMSVYTGYDGEIVPMGARSPFTTRATRSTPGSR